jgi:hypothetical protein
VEKSVSELNDFQNRMDLLRTELQGRMSEFQSKLGELPAKVAEQLSQKIDAMFADIDPETSPRAYQVKSAGNNVLDLIGGLVHAVAELEKDLAGRTQDKSSGADS